MLTALEIKTKFELCMQLPKLHYIPLSLILWC